MELLQTFEYEELKVETYYIGTDKLHNKTYVNGKLIYEDDTFRPSPMYNIDDTECMVSLLGFLTLSDWDIDKDFFEKRNAPLLDQWANNNYSCESIKLMINDFELADDEDFLRENEMTYEEATKIENYIKWE